MVVSRLPRGASIPTPPAAPASSCAQLASPIAAPLIPLSAQAESPPPAPPPPTRPQRPLRSPFGKRKITQAEDYDIGGEGVAYHDDTPGNQSGTYRPTEGVDVADITGARVVGRVDQGEWLEYTIRS